MFKPGQKVWAVGLINKYYVLQCKNLSRYEARKYVISDPDKGDDYVNIVSHEDWKRGQRWGSQFRKDRVFLVKKEAIEKARQFNKEHMDDQIEYLNLQLKFIQDY